ncbi:MAG: hypothetical protein LAO79_11680 [Acidobacteriia bacterium]|nr:hypothetical protein [Terriglobia bacterium]
MLDEMVWRAWLENSNLRGQASARKMKIAGGILLISLLLGTVVYRLVVMPGV